MKNIFLIVSAILCFGISGHAEMKIADLDKLVVEGKGEKKADGVYLLPDKVVINGKDFSKTKYGALYSSRNLEYFLLKDDTLNSKDSQIAKLFDKKGNLVWDLKDPGDFFHALISDQGIVSLFYGEMIAYVVTIIDKNGREIKEIKQGDVINGDSVKNIYTDHAQFAKNSDMLFILTYCTAKQLVLLGIDGTGEITYMEKVTGSPMKDVDNWYARIYYSAKLNQLLIDSSGIGDAPPMLTYWSFPQKLIFNKKTDKDEVILNASFADNNDILLRVKKKDGAKIVRRLSPNGGEKGNKSDVQKMDAQERALSKEKPLKVRSLNWGRE